VSVKHYSEGSNPSGGTWKNAQNVILKVWVTILFAMMMEKLLKQVVNAENAGILNA